MNGKGFWVKDYNIIDVSMTRHIRVVIACPECFSATKDEIWTEYKKFHEPIGFEGKARKEILKKVLDNNWIRVREEIRTGNWTIEFANYESQIDIINDLEIYIVSCQIDILQDVYIRKICISTDYSESTLFQKSIPLDILPRSIEIQRMFKVFRSTEEYMNAIEKGNV